jgi:hypothetical protein
VEDAETLAQELEASCGDWAWLESSTDRARLLAAIDGVVALAEKWRYKGEFGWGAWQEGHGPDETGTALDHASSELIAAVVAALGEGL